MDLRLRLLIVTASVMTLAILGLTLLGSGTSRAQADGVELRAGFNNVAYLGPTLAVEDGLGNAAASVSRIWRFENGAAPGDPSWALWDASLPGPLQGIDTLDYGRAYFVVSSGAVVWEYTPGETPAPPASVQLTPGLNHVVYFGEGLPVAAAAERLSAAGLRSQQTGLGCLNLIWSFTTDWLLWNPTLPSFLLGFTDLAPNTAYFVDATAACTWDFTPPIPAELDYGDAPDSYGTTQAAAGAAHGIEPGLFLGAGVDADPDGQPSAGASGDDQDANGDDEDGVVFTLQPAQGIFGGVSVTASSDGLLDAWIDFGQDGTFDPSDQIFASEPLAAGDNALIFAVPANAVVSADGAVARFRFSSAGGLSPTGIAPNGEVEDYTVPVVDAIVSCNGSWNDTRFGAAGAFTLMIELAGNEGLLTITMRGGPFFTVFDPGTVSIPFTVGTDGRYVIQGDGGFLGQADLLFDPASGTISGEFTGGTGGSLAVLQLTNATVALPELGFDIRVLIGTSFFTTAAVQTTCESGSPA